MDYPEFRNRALEYLRLINAKLKHAILIDAQKFDLTDTQLFLMGFLLSKGNANIGEIATEFNSDCANISPLCKKLERRGFVNRIRSKNDERVVLVSLSEKGTAIVKEVFGKLDKKFQSAFGNIDAGEATKILFNLNEFALCFDYGVEGK